MALLWAWSRVFLGVSDDPFKPLLASFWACFHILLAHLVIRRAHWPDDRRYATRHTVYVPVVFKSDEQDVRGLGFTSDLNDLGMSLITYHPLAEGGGGAADRPGPGRPDRGDRPHQARPASDGQPPGPGGTGGGFRHGVQFITPSDQTKDQLNLLCLHYAVPRLYKQYAEGHRPVWLAVPIWLAHRFYYRRASERRDSGCPCTCSPRGPGDGPVRGHRGHQPDRHGRPGPGRDRAGDRGPVHGRHPAGRTERDRPGPPVRPVDIASRPYHRLVVDFDHLDEEGRVLIADLMGPAGRNTGGCSAR